MGPFFFGARLGAGLLQGLLQRAGNMPNFLLGADVHHVMKTSIRRRAAIGCLFTTALFVVLGGAAFGKSMNCHDSLPATHTELAKDDQNTANHLELSRKVGPEVAMVLDICDADVTIKGSNGDLLRVSVDIASPAPKMTAGDYLQGLDITPHTANVRLHLPARIRAKVVIVVPSATPKLELNLVSGELAFETDRISGEREINVVDGHIELLANADSYGTLEVNVVMGSFHDRHAGESGGPALVSRSLTGTGKGSLEVNLVKGSVELKPWD